jgi:AcrR family transcriptional regulator
MTNREWTEDDLRTMCTDGVRPPPWVDEAFDQAEADLVTDAFFEQLQILGPALSNIVTEKQFQILLAAFTMGAAYGWDRAMTHGPMSQLQATAEAVAARKKAQDEARQKVRDAFDQASRAGEEVTVQELAKRCGVSRATAYRALRDE